MNEDDRKKISKNSKSARFLIFTAETGVPQIEVHIEDETIWLTQKLMAELFDVDVRTINEHLQNIFKSEELLKNTVIRNFRITANDGKVYDTNHYNLDAVIAVGYRVNSKQATQFRIWATVRLRDYIIKGFALDDERMKQGGERARYFEELLQRVRDIRSSERNFYQKVTDIYATSIDYRKDSQLTQKFFASVQNKMHYAVHGHTAAEILIARADSKRPMMGLTNFKGKYLTVGDIKTAKNYLSEKELNQLNLIVSLYLDFAELQATNERPMKMAEWAAKLDDFLKLSEKKVLTNAGSVSAKKACAIADIEFVKYKKEQDKKRVSDFDLEVKKFLEKVKDK